ncbi:MAG: M2 family metallopeptidase [Planctomycetota bacterium]
MVRFTIGAGLFAVLIGNVRVTAAELTEADFVKIRDAYVTKYKPLFEESARAWWEANTTGADAAFQRKTKAEEALVELHSDKDTFAKLKAFREAGTVKDPKLARQLDVMHRSFLPGQADPELQKKIVGVETEVEKIFNTHRSQVGDKALTENDVRQVVGDSKDSKAAEQAWKAYMEVGAKIAPKLAEVVKMRNELAQKLGFRNFFAMKLALQEIDEKELMKLFDELDALTREPFAALKKEIDEARAKKFGIAVADLRPWHFGDLFFQEAPELEQVNLDDVYKDKDMIALAKTYYEGLGMDVDKILSRSDLYEKPGKSPHAFSTNLNRADDVRVLCNLKPNLYWADTLLHELGHAVYDQYISTDIPFVIHEPSHSLTTEGYAMMVGAVSKNEEWLAKALGVPADQAKTLAAAGRRTLRAEKLIFSRWSQVMTRFEQGMYDNPEQDLGKLWWDLKKKYQLLNPPESTSRPDYAAKIHVVTAPVYYHSYLMGELFATQLHSHIATSLLGVSDPRQTAFLGKKEVGTFLREKVFGPGNLYSWNDLTKFATGEPLSAKAFAKLYVNP